LSLQLFHILVSDDLRCFHILRSMQKLLGSFLSLSQKSWLVLVVSVCGVLALRIFWTSRHNDASPVPLQWQKQPSLILPIKCNVLARDLTAGLGDCELCEQHLSLHGAKYQAKWSCAQCMNVSVTRLSDWGVEEPAEWVRNLVPVNGVCTVCSQVPHIRPRPDDCEECLAVESNLRDGRTPDYRCLTYSTNAACEQLGLTHCHRCREAGQPGYFSCLKCAKGISLLEGRCSLRRKHLDVGLNRIMADSIASNQIEGQPDRVMDVGTLG